MLICGISASAQTPDRYDANKKSIVSGYYQIDPETGFITGIPVGTSMGKLQKVCVGVDAGTSDDAVVSGATLQVGDKTATAIITGDLNGTAQPPSRIC